MSHSIVGIATSSSQVEAAVIDLQSRCGIETSQISVLIPDSGSTPNVAVGKATKAPEGATTGAVTGGIAGGTLGLLAGIGALAIPGLGAFIAAGPIMAALSGAAAGAATLGIVGGLVGLGIPEYEAKAYENRIKDGGYLIAVHIEEGDKDKDVRGVFEDHGIEDVAAVSEKK